jgi:hypothetical protein
LRDKHEGRITQEAVESSIKGIVSLGVRCNFLDQTILQAIQFFQSYIALNTNVHPSFIQAIEIVAVEIAIKNNEVF